jgi:hypothetical protein
MKIKYIIPCLFLIFLYACSSGKFGAGKPINKEMTIDFNGLTSSEIWLVFDMKKSDKLTVNFSKGTVNSDNQYMITAKEYSINNEPVIVTLLPPEEEGVYSFELVFAQSSGNADIAFTNGDSIRFPELVVQGWWKTWLWELIAAATVILIIVVWLVWFLYHGWKDKNTFDYGELVISYPPPSKTIYLEDRSKINLAKELKNEDISCVIYCETSTRMEDSEEIEEKEARVEADSDIIMKINNNEKTSEYLKNGDKIEIFTNDNKKLTELRYNN